MLIDDKIVRAFIHHANHMEHERYIPKEILDIEFEIKGGGLGRTTVRKQLETYRERVLHLAEYFKLKD
jgi:hypothetical protein